MFNKDRFRGRHVEKKPKEKKCKMVIKRDKEGKVKEKSFEGCTPQEIKVMEESTGE